MGQNTDAVGAIGIVAVFLVQAHRPQAENVATYSFLNEKFTLASLDGKIGLNNGINIK